MGRALGMESNGLTGQREDEREDLLMPPCLQCSGLLESQSFGGGHAVSLYNCHTLLLITGFKGVGQK